MKLTAICVLAILGVATDTASANVTIDDETDIFLTVFIACAVGGAGEVVDLSGPLHTVISSEINNNDVSGYFHFQPQGIRGVGEVSGIKYQATGVTQESFKTSLLNGQANLTFVNNFRIVGQGPANNFLVHETLHITVNADGTTSVVHDNFTVDCK